MTFDAVIQQLTSMFSHIRDEMFINKIVSFTWRIWFEFNDYSSQMKSIIRSRRSNRSISSYLYRIYFKFSSHFIYITFIWILPSIGVPCSWYHCIYTVIGWNKIGFFSFIAKNDMYHASYGARTYSRWSIQIVGPTGHRF